MCHILIRFEKCDFRQTAVRGWIHYTVEKLSNICLSGRTGADLKHGAMTDGWHCILHSMWLIIQYKSPSCQIRENTGPECSPGVKMVRTSGLLTHLRHCWLDIFPHDEIKFGLAVPHLASQLKSMTVAATVALWQRIRGQVHEKYI